MANPFNLPEHSHVPEYLRHTGTGQPLGWLKTFARDTSAPPPGTPLPDDRSGLTQYLLDQAKMFDPRTLEGIGNIAATFVPGPGRGGRFVGKLEPEQKAFMNQLQNVVDEAGDASAAQRYWENVSMPPNFANRPAVEGHPASKAIADVLGYSQGYKPWEELQQYIGENVESRLGTDPNTGFPSAYVNRSGTFENRPVISMTPDQIAAYLRRRLPEKTAKKYVDPLGLMSGDYLKMANKLEKRHPEVAEFLRGQAKIRMNLPLFRRLNETN